MNDEHIKECTEYERHKSWVKTLGDYQRPDAGIKEQIQDIRKYCGFPDYEYESRNSQVKARVDSISAQMESDQAWTKNRLDDLGESDCKIRKVVIWFLIIEKNIKVSL